MNNVILRMAWRNLWRQGKRTWLTVGAMIFSNSLLVFSISLQFGSYQMMIDNSLQAFSGHIQLQHPSYLEQPKMRYAIDNIADRAQRLRDEFDLTNISARAAGFARPGAAPSGSAHCEWLPWPSEGAVSAASSGACPPPSGARGCSRRRTAPRPG